MPNFETTGQSAGISPQGKLTVKIPISSTDDQPINPPTTPAGTNLVGLEYTVREDGGRDYVFNYESIDSNFPGSEARDPKVDPVCQISGQAAQEPIETHPKFAKLADGTENVTETDLAEIRKALDDGRSPTFTATGAQLQKAQDLYKLMVRGITHYYTASGITYSETTEQVERPDIKELCRIDKPPLNAPLVLQNSNWLQIGLNAEKIFVPYGKSFWRVTREWLASGPRGWNADYVIYGD